MNSMRYLYTLFYVFVLSCYGSRHDDSYMDLYRHYAHTIAQDTAIVVIGFNRPQYFQKVVTSLAKNPEAQTLPFFFILDGGTHATQEENIRIISDAPIAHKVVIARPRNLGLSRNIIDARRFIFDYCDFSRAIIFEDDLVVSPHYIHLTLALHDWARENFDNVGIVQGWSFCTLEREKKEAYREYVKETFAHWWGYCLDKQVWDQIKDTLYEYERVFLSKNVRRPRDVRAWIVKQLALIPERFHVCTYPVNLDYQHIFSSPALATGQDSITAFALWKAGYIRVAPVVNRGLYIGKSGKHFNPHIWQRMGFSKIKAYYFDDDATRETFIIKI